MKKLLSIIALISCLTVAHAQTVTYTWVENVHPKLPKNIKPLPPSVGYFTVPLAAVQTGVIIPSDLLPVWNGYPFYFYTSARYLYLTVNDGAFNVDPNTGQLLSGYFHSYIVGHDYTPGAYSYSYGDSVHFYPTKYQEDNPMGGGYGGYWAVTFNP